MSCRPRARCKSSCASAAVNPVSRRIAPESTAPPGGRPSGGRNADPGAPLSSLDNGAAVRRSSDRPKRTILTVAATGASNARSRFAPSPDATHRTRGGGDDMAANAGVQEPPEARPLQKGLKANAIGFASSVVIGVASTAPGYSLAAVLGLVVAGRGDRPPGPGGLPRRVRAEAARRDGLQVPEQGRPGRGHDVRLGHAGVRPERRVDL